MIQRSMRTLGVLALLLAPLAACKQGETTAPDEAAATSPGHGQQHGKHHDDSAFEGREVVPNYRAKTGDVTTCPCSGRKFEVEDASPRYEYQGHSFVFCGAQCLDKVEAEPDKFLGELVEQANASATEPAVVPASESPPSE